MDELTQSKHNRFDVFAANCFIVLLLVLLAIVIVRFSVAYWGFYRLDPSYFLSSTTVNAGTLGYYEFVILSLNNLPLAAAAGHAVSLMCRVI
jgi:hypothetical protein